MNDEELSYYTAIPPVVIVNKCVNCGATVTESLDLNTECVRQGGNCYFEVHPAPGHKAQDQGT